MRLILKVKKRDKYPRYIYTVQDDTGKVYDTRRSDRKYVACLFRHDTERADNYFGRIDLIGKGWNSDHFRWLKRNNYPFSIVYTKEGVEGLVKHAYENVGIQAAVNEADKHATVIDKYCSGCDNYYPAFKDEEFCLICGSAHDKRKDPDLLIPLENKE